MSIKSLRRPLGARSVQRVGLCDPVSNLSCDRRLVARPGLRSSLAHDGLLALAQISPGGLSAYRMFRDAKLPDVFQQVAGPAEWEEFCALEPPRYEMIVIGGPPDPPNPQELSARRYEELWTKFAQATKAKLIDGEWVADGFDPQLGAHPVRIDVRLWRALEFSICGDVAEGHGYKFSNLFFSQAKPEPVSQRDLPHLRKELIRWIEALGRAARGPVPAPEVRDAARRAFSGTTISDNLFREAWKVADKPKHFVQRGRPKLKVSGK